jgi:hypothetical protein
MQGLTVTAITGRTFFATDKLVFEFVTDADAAARRTPKALPPPKKSKAEENV